MTLGAPGPSHAADSVKFGPYDVRSAFHVEKSENKNEVHYAVRLDAACRPQGKRPVFAYWQRYRKTGRINDPLVGAGTRVYGASDEQTVTANPITGGRVSMYVKALKRLTVDLRIEKVKDLCQVTPTVSINGERARLSHAFLQLGRFGITVKYVDVVGMRERDGQRITERFK